LVRSPWLFWRKSLPFATTFLAVTSSSVFARADRSSTTIDQGYDLGQVQQPRSVAMAGAQEAWGGSTVAVFNNPANLPLARVYHLEGLAAFSPEARRQSYGGAVVDSSTSRFAGGFGGTWNQMDPDGINRTWTDLRLTLAYPFGDRLSIGATGRYLRVTQRTSAGPLGASLASDGTSDQPLFNQFTFDAGAAVTLAEGLRLGVSGHNLTATGTSIAPLLLASGIGYSNQIVTIEGDVQIDFTTYSTARPRTMFGAEYMLIDRVPLRAGYRYDAGSKTQALSLGVGYIDRRFSVEISARRDVAGDHPATMMSAGLRIFIDAAALGGSGQDSQPDSF